MTSLLLLVGVFGQFAADGTSQRGYMVLQLAMVAEDFVCTLASGITWSTNAVCRLPSVCVPTRLSLGVCVSE